MMLPKHSLSVLALGSLLAACTLAPPVEVPVPPATPQATPEAAAVTPTPGPSAAAEPASPAVPTATPYQWQPTGVEPVKILPPQAYEDASLGLTIRDASYDVTGSAATGFTAQARMAVTLAGQPTTTVTFEEFDGPDTGSGDDEDDHITITDTRTGDTRTYGADQGLVNFWVGELHAMPVYRVRQFGSQDFYYSGFRLMVKFLDGGMYMVNDYHCPMTLEEAAMAAAHSPQLKDTSLASLVTLYTVLRERRFDDASLGLTSFYRALEGQRPAGTRVVMPPRLDKHSGGSKLGRYRTMSEAEVAYNPAAALLKAVIDVRMRENFDPEAGFEAVYCDPPPQ